MEENEEEEQGWYSVWAQPSPADEPAGLRPAMLQLRTLFEGPLFEPHVTVLGVQKEKVHLRDASKCLRAACRSLRPFTCRLTRVECGQTFFQCVYMLVEPSQEVMEANKHVQNIFSNPNSVEAVCLEKNDYMPHLSLLYGDLTPENKEKAKKLVEDECSLDLCNTQFRVSSLCLYSTDTNDKLLASWRKIAEYPLEVDNI